MAIDPNHEEPPRALAIALMEQKSLGEAEKVIRAALRSIQRERCCQLHLTLGRLLIQRGDESGEADFYEEALKEIGQAIRLRTSDAEPYFFAGIARARLNDYSGAYRNFMACLNRDLYHFEADRNARRVKKRLAESAGIRRKGIIAGYVIIVCSLFLLLTLWFFYFQAFFPAAKVSETTLTVMTPILLGLVVVGFLLPELNRIKLPGMEAELIQPKDTISSGPKLDIGFGSYSPSISTGPRLT
jgi:tetratricopeptide (TPR) repeat protein